MNYIDKLETDSLKKEFLTFIETYGADALHQAMDSYINAQQIYICRTRTSTSKIYIKDISYIEVHKHIITIHTSHGCFQKYGTLNNELEHLSKYGFIKCSQNYIVPLAHGNLPGSHADRPYKNHPQQAVCRKIFISFQRT